MPKVLRIVNRFNLGGITYNVSFLSAYMGPEFETLLVGGPQELHEKNSLFIPRQHGLNPRVIPEMRRSLNPFKDLMAYFAIKRIIREFKPDIVHTHASKAGFIGRLAARSEKVGCIVHTFHGHVLEGYFNPVLTWLIKQTERYLARYTQVLIAISPKQAEDLALRFRIAPMHKFKVIRLGFDLSKYFKNELYYRSAFRKNYGLPDSTLALGIIGRLAPIKQHSDLITQVARIYSQTQHPFKIFIIGDGETRPLLESQISSCIKSGKLPQNSIVFTGWIERLEEVLHGLDAVLLCSRNEGTPVSLIEAQAAGITVISTNVGGVEDILMPPHDLLSNAHQLNEFGDHLLKFINNPEHYRSRAGAFREQIKKTYSYQRLCSEMQDLYNRYLNR